VEGSNIKSRYRGVNSSSNITRSSSTHWRRNSRVWTSRWRSREAAGIDHFTEVAEIVELPHSAVGDRRQRCGGELTKVAERIITEDTGITHILLG
jgi:hypothetical protein